MKKYFSNIRTLAALLMAGAAFAACSSDESSIEQPVNPTAAKTYTLTINATKDGSAATRALSLDGTALVAKWETTDEVSVFKAENRSQCTAANLLGTISPVVGTISADGDEATFSGDITGTVTDGDKLMLVYHPAAFAIAGYEGQAGTLASASALDCATAAVTASVSGSDITISEASATFTAQTAVLKLTLTTDGTTTINPTQLKMTMSAETTTLYEFTFSPVAATYTANGDGVLYFALPSATDVAEGLGTTTTALTAVTITYTATVGTDTYTATKTGYNFAAGTYYAGTLTMEKEVAATPLDNTTTAWADGSTYAVPAGGLTYSAAITVSGDVTLVLTAGATLTLNKGISIADGATLTVQGTGTMTVNGTNGSTASTEAGTGTLVLTSGTLNATGGNGAGVGEPNQNNFTANAGGVAINGAVTVSGGTLTATGGNGGSITAYFLLNSKGGAGGAAISGALTINGGTVTTTDGTNGSVASNNSNCTAGAGGAAAVGGVTDNR